MKITREEVDQAVDETLSNQLKFIWVGFGSLLDIGLDSDKVVRFTIRVENIINEKIGENVLDISFEERKNILKMKVSEVKIFIWEQIPTKYKE